MADCFICYAHEDRDFVARLNAALKARGRSTSVDVQDLLPAEKWAARIQSLIRESDNFVFVASPRSAASVECSREVEFAVSCGKRIVPIVCRDVDFSTLPRPVMETQAISFLSDFEAAADSLVRAFETDLRWVRSHSRLEVRAAEWKGNGQDASFVLRGRDLAEAEGWLLQGVGKEIRPTELQVAYIQASRADADRRRRRTVTVLALALVITSGFAVWAEFNRRVAERQTRVVRSRQLTADARLAEKEHPVRAILLAAEAVEVARQAGDAVDPDVEQTLRDLVGSHGGRGLPGHHLGIADLAVSRDGRRLATAGKDRTIRLWDLTRGGEPDRLEVLPLAAEPARIAFGPGGLLAAGTQGGAVELWNLAAPDASVAHPLPGAMQGPVSSLAFSPDGQWLAAGGQSRSVQLWRIDSAGKQAAAFSLPGHGLLVNEVTFSPDSRWLATVDGYDGMLRLWNLQDADPAAHPSVIAAGAQVMEVLFDPLGRWVATGHYTGQVRLWPLSLAGAAPQPRDFAPGIGAVYSIAVDPGGRWLAAAGNSGAALWDLTKPDPSASQKLLIDQSRDVGAIAGEFMLARFSPDGQWLLITKANQGLLWKLRAAGPGYNPDAVLAGHEDVISSAVFSPDSRWLATATRSIHYLKEDAVPRLWSLASGVFDASPREEAKDLASLPGIGLTPDRKQLLTLGATGAVTAWTVGPDRPAAQPRSLLQDEELAWIEGVSTGLATVTAAIRKEPKYPRVLLARGATGGYSKELLTCNGAETDNTAVSPDGHWIAGATVTGGFCLWDRRSAAGGRQLLAPAPGVPMGTEIAFSADGRWLATSRGNTVTVWDLRGPAPGAGRVLAGLKSAPGAIAFSPDNRWLVAGDRKGLVLLWEWRDGAGGKIHTLPGHTDRLRAFAFSPKGRWLASAGYDRTVRLWDLSAREPESTGRPLEGHTHYVLALAFIPDERLLLSGSLDSTIRLWNLAGHPISSAALRTTGAWATGLALDPANRWLLATTDSSSGPGVQIFDLGLSELLAAAQKYAGRNLTQREWEQYFPDQPLGKTFPGLPAPEPPKVRRVEARSRGLAHNPWKSNSLAASAWPPSRVRKSRP